MTLNGNGRRTISKPSIGQAGVDIPDYATVRDLNAAKPGGCVAAVITVDRGAGGSIRFNVNGQDPRSGNGHVLDPDDVLELQDPDEVNRFRVALETGTSALIFVTYY